MHEDDKTNAQSISIPHELIFEILTRLPVKSLTQFRSVSTRWNSTILHPSFSKSHFLRSTATAGGASVTLVLAFINRFNSERTFYSVKLPFKHKPIPNPTHILTIPGFAHPFISPPLNGLVCLNLGSMCVCNPSTRQFVKLPWTQPETNSSSPGSTSRRSNAFGFDPVCNTHKVLDTWITFNDDEIVFIEHRVFTVGLCVNKWRKIDGPSYFPFNEGVCIDGHIYFRAFRSMMASEKPVMVDFDVNQENFRFIEMHDDVALNSEESVLMRLDGRLVVVDYQCVTSGEDDVLLMWTLVGDASETWVKKRVRNPAIRREMDDSRAYKFVGTTFSGEMIFTEKRLVNLFFVLLYDIKKNEMRKVEVCGLTDFEFRFGHAVMNLVSVDEHVESILSLS